MFGGTYECLRAKSYGKTQGSLWLDRGWKVAAAQIKMGGQSGEVNAEAGTSMELW